MLSPIVNNIKGYTPVQQVFSYARYRYTGNLTGLPGRLQENSRVNKRVDRFQTAVIHPWRTGLQHYFGLGMRHRGKTDRKRSIMRVSAGKLLVVCIVRVGSIIASVMHTQEINEAKLRVNTAMFKVMLYQVGQAQQLHQFGIAEKMDTYQADHQNFTHS